MRGKPLLVAAATFLIVLIGGAALAGVGTFGSGADLGAYELGTDPVPEVPNLAAGDTTTTTAAEAKPTTTLATDATEMVAEAKEGAEPAKEQSEAKDESDKAEEPDHESKDPVELFSITKPKDGDHVTTNTVTFGGEVVDGAVVQRGKYTAEQSAGTWSLTLVLSPGKNRVGFTAVGAGGTVQEQSVTVYYDAPSDEGEKDGDHEEEQKKQESHEFWAKQKYGSCGEAVPYDVFYGTAKPGTTISVTSPYGSGSTTATEHGEWKVKVEFPGAPAGETFTVTVSASTGESKTFTFLNTGDNDGKDR